MSRYKVCNCHWACGVQECRSELGLVKRRLVPQICPPYPDRPPMSPMAVVGVGVPALVLVVLGVAAAVVVVSSSSSSICSGGGGGGTSSGNDGGSGGRWPPSCAIPATPGQRAPGPGDPGPMVHGPLDFSHFFTIFRKISRNFSRELFLIFRALT